MIRNFFTLAIRNLRKRKLYSFINIFGLAIGVAVCLVILKYVDFELSYDTFHPNAANVYRMTTMSYRAGEFRGNSVISGYAQGPAMLADVPEVKRYIRTHPMYGGAVVIYKRDNGDPSTFHEENMQFADSTFLDVFTYTALEGDLNTALDNPASVVITKKMADKYFKPGEDPLGKILKISGGWADGDYEVTAVLKEVPGNSHFQFDFLFPTHNLLRNEQYTHDNGWGWNNFVTYVELHDHTDSKKVEAKLPAFVDKYRGKDLAESNSKNVLKLQPILDIHLSPGLDYESSATVSVNTIYFFVVIAIFVLAIAWVNYINLSTARAMERAREVGIKKSVGAHRSQLISQFIFESVLVNLISVVLATLLAVGLLPVLGEIVGKDLTFDFGDYRFWVVLTTLFLIGSFVSGIYPAFILSSFKITEVLKGKVEKMTGGFSLRKALVVFQFASSLILIAGTFAIYRQMIFMKNQDKGLTMDQMLIVNGPSVLDRKSAKTRLMSLKNQLKEVPGVTGVATSAAIPGGGYNWGTGMRRSGTEQQESKDGKVVWVDPDFVSTYGITILAGRSFNPSIASDMRSVLVNEAALTTFGLGTAEHALEERLLLGGDTVQILGVLKNYHWNSLKTEHSPWLLKADTISGHNYSIHINSNNMQTTIAKIESLYKEAFPGNPFDYYFLDDFFNSQYKSEQQFGKIFSMFSMLAIIIACLGLWGLASFTTAQKLKEIGIRKVLGASVGSIMSLLSWQFFKLVLIASVIAIPLTWYGIDAWLAGFAFRIGLQWDLFVVPVVILSLLALGTVSFQIFRGANINPAKILRTE
ncbi:ABC transporter permease [Chryseolinea soli]|uniref:ABC transporter permease n=1 Tax=Chryseolinea soli TaxID=2321403 RepID=A0A385SR95_9BACT|nr:ABC transporter permease [Chryseolinea soli]AYB32120.1 ABC transporter permease [Chryseolinea soli]